MEFILDTITEVLVSIVAADVLVPKYQAIRIHNTDFNYCMKPVHMYHKTGWKHKAPKIYVEEKWSSHLRVNIECVLAGFSSPGTPTMMDTSLTNIQWLGAMNGTGMPLQQSPNLTELTSSSTPAPTTSQTPLELSQDSLPSNDSGFVSDQSGNQASLLSNNSILGLQSPFTTATISLPNDHRDIRVIASEKQIEKVPAE